MENTNYTNEEILNALEILKHLANNQEVICHIDEKSRLDLLIAAGKISRPNKEDIKKRNKEYRLIDQKKTVEENRQKRALTGIRSARLDRVFTAPEKILIESDKHYEEAPELTKARNCYVCKAEFKKLHFFYDTMCKDCGDFNYHKRFQRADMTGQVVLITGSRLKIGYQATIMLLQSGATVIATTRFPVDSAMRFMKEKDYHEWKDRLHIYGLDLRHTPSVEIFARYVEENFHRLDHIINNAAQTVRRPPGFYSHMMELEKTNYHELPLEAQTLLKKHQELRTELNRITLQSAKQIDMAQETALPVTWHGEGPGVGIRASAELSQIPYSYDNSLVAEEVFPEGQLDCDLQQVDLRKTNSWRMKLGDVPTPELLEVQLVNSIAPFVLINRLIHLMRKDYTGCKHIVNVTAMEGKFFRFHKEDRHPHTNMAKAALNMMTHTSASDFAKDGIYMNAVDTGWVTDEDPADMVKDKQAVHDFQPPLDIVDGAARICDPFIDGINSGKHWCGQFLKDYKPIDW